MADQVPAPGKKSGAHKLAASALAILTVIVALSIYNGFKPSSETMRSCISAGGASGLQESRCRVPAVAIGAILLVLVLGMGAAKRAWKNE
jgi:hypothetical protein